MTTINGEQYITQHVGVNGVPKHIKLFPQRDEHLFFSVPGVRDHAHALRCEFSKWRTG